MLNHNETECLRKAVFFGALPDDVFTRIAAHATSQSIGAGQVLFRQGDPARMIYCVAEGIVKLWVSSRNGDEVVVEIFREGQCFAEALAFNQNDYPVSASALTTAQVLGIPRSVIQTELRANPDAFPALLTSAYQHLHGLIRQVEQLKAASGLERVAGFVLSQAEAGAGSSKIHIPYEKQELASMLGIKRETLSRAFKRLSGHGLRVDGPTMEITDRAALEAFLSRE